MTIAELTNVIFGLQPTPLGAQCAAWMAASRRFRAFVESYRDKIRKKVRSAEDAEGLGDVQAELAIAHALLQERRFSVEYEAYAAEKQRGPDFTVAFTTRLHFNVEVTRLRGATSEAVDAPVAPSRLALALCAKLRQLPPSSINLLVLVVSGHAQQADVAQAVKLLKLRAEQRDEEYFLRHGMGGSREFHTRYARLSGVLIAGGSGETRLWQNPEGRHLLPVELETILRRCVIEPATRAHSTGRLASGAAGTASG